ncbi:MAG: hypothetical protein GX945_16025 [Lentisphaerae bacterium]|jgi:hypothetical protein|nr:hypothetical protein [Lentisphaerota bacterium]
MKNRGMSLIVLFVLFAVTASTYAVSLNPFRRNARARAETLMITANVLDSRLLAELAQVRTKQPIILLSPDVDGTQRVFYMIDGGKAVDIGEANFLETVGFINPKRVVVLGGADYVPRQFVEPLRDNYSVITLDSADWNKNAQVLGEWLDHRSLAKQYREYSEKISQADAGK